MLNDLKKEIKIIQRQLVFCGVYAILLSIAFVFVAYLAIDMKRENDVLRSVNETLIELQKESVEVPTEGIELSNIPVEVAEYQEVYFTNYYQGDGSSTSRVGANTPDGERITTDLFEVNEMGWYTYNGKVVVATATHECIKSNYEACALYNEYEEGITYYSYHDEIEIEVKGVRYKAIVLDSCGKSHDKEYLNKYDEGLNRIDIFVVNKNHSIGKAKGRVYES